MSKEKTKPAIKLAATAIVILVVIVPVLMIKSCVDDALDPGEPTVSEHSNVDRPNQAANMTAYNISRDYVKKYLKSPSTAEFPSVLEKKNHVRATGDTLFVTASWVDSKNALGGMVRTKWTTVLKIKGESVELLGLDIDGQRII